jgi:hypothetical protein
LWDHKTNRVVRDPPNDGLVCIERSSE